LAKENNITPPRLPLQILKQLCKPEYHADIEGDLLQLYHRRLVEKGKRRADLMLMKDVLLLLRPGDFRTRLGTLSA